MWREGHGRWIVCRMDMVLVFVRRWRGRSVKEELRERGRNGEKETANMYFIWH